MELHQVIANSLIREVDKVIRAWKPFIQSQPNIAMELQQLATREPTNSAEFLTFLFKSGEKFSESLLVSVLLEPLRPRIIDLISRRSTAVEQKKRLVKEGDYLQAGKVLCVQKSLTGEINDELTGQNLVITVNNVTDAVNRLGWPTDSTVPRHNLGT